MAPSESLIALSREQDALCRAVAGGGLGVGRVVISARSVSVGKLHDVQVRLTANGVAHCGQAEHPDPETALRDAYTSLLRNVVRATPCTYVAAA